MLILIINGPNLNMLGYREPEVYGDKKYDDLYRYLETCASHLDIELKILQSDHEGKIVEMLHDAYFEKYDGVIINAGAYTHYSYAIRDALAILSVPKVEVHLSDVMNREDFRKISVIEDVCSAKIYGKGFESYKEALEYIKAALTKEPEE